MESQQAQWERKTFNDYDRRCSKEDDYNRAVEMEIESIKEDIANGDDDVMCAFSEKMFDDDEFLKAVALGTDYEEMRIKILTAMAEDRLEQLVGKNSATFAISVMQIANSNTMLRTADPTSIFNAACMAATLNLPLQNGLGFAYIVPFRNNKERKVEAQFQLGYKGLIQLAQRSGQFKRLVAVPVYEKQLIEEDPINGYVFDWKQKPTQEEKPIGYYAYFELLNSFTAELYMTEAEIDQHAQRYSQTYRTYLDKKAKGQWATSVWADNFEAMALKTVMKLLLSKQAPLSVEMQQAVLADQAVVKDA